MLVRLNRRAVPLLIVVLAVSACAQRADRAPVVFRGTQPSAPAASASPATAAPLAPPADVAAAPSASGIVDYGGYRAMVAQPGDTVDSMAARAGLNGAALAAYNGLPTGHVPRPGDELILPPDTPVQVAAADPSVTAAPLEPAEAGNAGSTFDLDRIDETLEETQSAATPTSEPTAAAPASTPPASAPATRLAEAPATEPAAASPTTAAAPAPAVAPAAAPAAAPNSARFVRPVSGTILRPFSRAGGEGRSDGVSFAAAAGSDVRAVDDGQVALVSEALGGDLGTVVLIRHGGQLLTVYGRVSPTVTQGDRVARGQVIGTVAAPGSGEPSMHFEVRRGTEPVDPAPFFES